MAISLQDYEHAAKTVKSGHDTVAVVAGQRFVVESSPGGADVLDVTCPAGKAWSVRVIVEITETDA